MKTIRKLLAALIITTALFTFGQTVKPGRIYLLKEKNHSIFIEKIKNSFFYDKICDFNFGKFDKSSYLSSIDYLKENKIRLTKVSTGDFPKRWITLKQYKGKFYTYYPSDFYSHYKVGITDTSFIEYTGEGPEAKKIISYKKIDNQTFQFILLGYTLKLEKLTVHLIDIKNGIAVFEENNLGQVNYKLMISADKIRNLPIIVNYCKVQKQVEFHFEKPNFKQLLKTK
jgi:hypothetical protein